MTAAERLLQLAGTTGTAAALLLSIGSGATAGEALNDYSSIESGTAAEHLLSERVVPVASLGGFSPVVEKKKKPKPVPEEIIEEPISAVDVSRIRNEFLSSALVGDLNKRAIAQKRRAEEEALLLML